MLCLHRLSPGNSLQRRSFLSFRVQRILSSLAGGKLTSQLGVAWLQFSEKGYSSRPYGSRNTLPTRRLRVRVRVTLRLEVYRQSVRLGVKPLEVHNQSLSLSN
jgi:hypothetical protein